MVQSLSGTPRSDTRKAIHTEEVCAVTREWRWNSKNGKAYFHAGVGKQDAVGAPKPSDAIPIQEGMRLMAAKGIDVIWKFAAARFVLKRIFRRKRKKH